MLRKLLLILFSVSTITPQATIGYVTSQENDLVSVELTSGEIFQFYADPGDYEKGDLCAMIIDNNGTTEVYDDIIIDAVVVSMIRELVAA